MLIKYNKLFFIFIILVIVIQGCKKTCGDGFTSLHESYAHILITPNTDTINIGDSIHFQIIIPYNLLDVRTNNFIDSKNLDFGELLTQSALYTARNGEIFGNGGVSSWTFATKEGLSKFDPNSGVRSRFSKTTNGHTVSFSLIPRHSGVASFYFFPLRAKKDRNCTHIDIEPIVLGASYRRHLFFDFVRYNSPNSNWYLRDKAYNIFIK